MARPIVVPDASVALKWFHAVGEEGVEDAQALLDAYGDRQIDIVVLDLMAYELGNALLRGVVVPPTAAIVVLDSLAEICEPTTMSTAERMLAATLTVEHRLTFYDAAYAAVASERGGILATHDRDLIRAGLGYRPVEALRRAGVRIAG